jgi:hypothetical protein
MPASSARQVTATTPSLPDIHTPLPGAFIPKAAATVNAASLRKFHLVADMQQLFEMIPARSANRQSSMRGLTFRRRGIAITIRKGFRKHE